MAYIDDIVKQVGNTASDVANGASSLNKNPYEYYYKDGFGYIFGKPMAFNLKADPHQRIYQRTMLRNSTIVNIIPGVPYTDTAMISKAQAILDDHQIEVDAIIAQYSLATDLSRRNARLAELSQRTQDKLLSSKCDLRYFTFKQDLSNFKQAFQMMVERTGSAIFGWTKRNMSSMLSDAINIASTDDMLNRGFKLWVDKATSISESVENSFSASVLEQAQKSASNIARQIKFGGGAVGLLNSEGKTEIEGSDQTSVSAGRAADIASRSVGGAVFQFPQVFDDSKFTRSYDLSFRFVSPYGDDRSIFYNVIMPFMFILTCALPRQEGVSGLQSPFILQLDSPGYFSCPMGVITSLSFNKGGDEKLFNPRGLPLILEGSISVADLYSNLSMPMNYSQFATNIGTAAFLNTLGGLSLYATMDPTLSKNTLDYATSVLTKVTYPFSKADEEIAKVRRYFGI